MTCSLCDRPGLARDLCNAHYKRWRKYGDPLNLAPPKKPKTHCVNGHRFDQANTYHRKDGKRTCKTCARFFSRRWHRAERSGRTGTLTPRPKPKTTRSLVDLLTLEGGWWTVDGIGLRLDVNPQSIRKALCRLKISGQVENRDRGGRWEWRALTLQEVEA